MEFPENLKHRIFYEKTLKRRWVKDIIETMQDGIVLEFCYQDKNGEELSYILSAPVCLKVFEKQWYLIGWNPNDKIRIYALDRIKMMGEEWTTFSLPKDTDYNEFIAKYFDINKVE